MDYNQFSQIAMIAQGQFTRLLNATTEERSRIFRKLFRTQRYQKLQEALAEENSALTAQRAALNAKLDAVLAGISYDAADPEAEALGALSAQMPPDAVATLLEGLTARQEAAAAQAADALAALDKQLSRLQTTLGAAEQAERQRQEVAGELAKARSTAQLESAKASTRRKTLEALDAALTASEAELAALADADTRRVELEAEAARLAQRETALNALNKESAAYISSIDAFYYSGKYTLTVRTVSSGGLYLPIVAEQTAQAVFDKAAELGITLSEYKVEEFSEGNSSKVENLILWKSADGVTGTYTDDTGSSPYIETDVTIERLAEIVR